MFATKNQIRSSAELIQSNFDAISSFLSPQDIQNLSQSTFRFLFSIYNIFQLTHPYSISILPNKHGNP